MCVISKSTGMNGVRMVHHISFASMEISILLYFWRELLVGNIQRKFPKNSSVTFICEESPYTT